MLNKIKKEIKNNKYTTAVFLIFLGIFIIGGIAYAIIMPSAGTPVYGNRLDGIEEVEITEEQTSTIVKALQDVSVVNSAKTHISGKIFNVIVEVKENTKVTTARNLTKYITKNLDEKQINFYDIQIFITNENAEKSKYPIIGYKTSSASNFSF